MIPLDVIVDWSLHNTFQSILPEHGQIVSIEQALSGHEERIEKVARYFCKYAKEYDPCLNNKGLSPSQSREILRLLYGFEKMYGFTREPVVNKLLLGSITEEDKKQIEQSLVSCGLSQIIARILHEESREDPVPSYEEMRVYVQQALVPDRVKFVQYDSLDTIPSTALWMMRIEKLDDHWKKLLRKTKPQTGYIQTTTSITDVEKELPTRDRIMISSYISKQLGYNVTLTAYALRAEVYNLIAADRLNYQCRCLPQVNPLFR
ncbi:MAG: hypothetical protein WC254_01450 [Candidatus Woesearchaeota archaeon]|jgi:hypothetical protein